MTCFAWNERTWLGRQQHVHHDHPCGPQGQLHAGPGGRLRGGQVATVGSVGSGKMLQHGDVQVDKEGVCQAQTAGSHSCRGQLQRLSLEGTLCRAPGLIAQVERALTVTGAGVRGEQFKLQRPAACSTALCIQGSVCL